MQGMEVKLYVMKAQPWVCALLSHEIGSMNLSCASGLES